MRADHHGIPMHLGRVVNGPDARRIQPRDFLRVMHQRTKGMHRMPTMQRRLSQLNRPPHAETEAHDFG